MAVHLTTTQRDTLQYLEGRLTAPVTYEVSQDLGISHSAAYSRLAGLRRLGLVESGPSWCRDRGQATADGVQWSLTEDGERHLVCEDCGDDLQPGQYEVCSACVVRRQCDERGLSHYELEPTGRGLELTVHVEGEGEARGTVWLGGLSWVRSGVSGAPGRGGYATSDEAAQALIGACVECGWDRDDGTVEGVCGRCLHPQPCSECGLPVDVPSREDPDGLCQTCRDRLHSRLARALAASHPGAPTVRCNLCRRVLTADTGWQCQACDSDLDAAVDAAVAEIEAEEPAVEEVDRA